MILFILHKRSTFIAVKKFLPAFIQFRYPLYYLHLWLWLTTCWYFRSLTLIREGYLFTKLQAILANLVPSLVIFNCCGKEHLCVYSNDDDVLLCLPLQQWHLIYINVVVTGTEGISPWIDYYYINRHFSLYKRMMKAMMNKKIYGNVYFDWPNEFN